MHAACARRNCTPATPTKLSQIVVKVTNTQKFSKKLKKVQSWTGVKCTGTSWMKLLNRCKKYRDKSVQLTIIISHTHAPLTTTPSLQITICNDTDGEHSNGATIQSCSGAWVWLIIIVSCTDLSCIFYRDLFSNFIQLVPGYSFSYTSSTLYLLKFFWKFLYV